MEKRITEYVDYHFRFDIRSDIDEVKKEFISNLIDRYNDYLNQGKSDEDAYIETIKYLGKVSDIESNDSDEVSGKMSWALVAMVTVTALAYSAVLLSIFSSLLGLIVTLVSIVLFSTAGYYLYSSSQFERREKFDLELQRVNLRIIMKNFRQNYLPWSISLTISFTSLVMGIILLITSENLASLIMADGLLPVILVYAIIGFVVFAIIFYLLKLFEKKLYSKYTLMTGEEVPNLEVSSLFKDMTFSLDINWYLVFFVLSTIGINLTSATVQNTSNWSVTGVFISLLPDLPILILPFLLSIILLLIIIIKKEISNRNLFLINLLNLISYMAISFYLEFYHYHVFSSVFGATVVLTIVLLILYFGPIIYGKLSKEKS